ncbi:MAG TPA: hypothetical protein VFI69_05435 [Candidatus Limnocylindrales bacterium]|jgi:uncharacterized Zn finger protein|nr:hypothetical protein [Candidatus Limnocylindrales bacterium]
MILIECPCCAGEATTDEALRHVRCEDCGVVADVAPDPHIAFDRAA